MDFVYLNKFAYLNTFMIELVHRCSDNGGPTVVCNVSVHQWHIQLTDTFISCLAVTQSNQFVFVLKDTLAMEHTVLVGTPHHCYICSFTGFIH